MRRSLFAAVAACAALCLAGHPGGDARAESPAPTAETPHGAPVTPAPTGAAGAGAAARGPAAADPNAALHLLVMDPLSHKLACACVAGYAQRRYDHLAEFMSTRLGRPVVVNYAESLAVGAKEAEGPLDLIVGKQTVVLADAAKEHRTLRPLARLTDKAGRTTLTGLFVVRTLDAARQLADLRDRRIVFGPPESEEKSAAACRALYAAGIVPATDAPTAPDCTAAAVAVADKRSDAAVISSYAYALLEGCHAVSKGELRVLAETGPVPFITVFATDHRPAGNDAAVVAALVAAKDDAELLKQMESRDGFVPITPHAGLSLGWPDWRGVNRDGISGDVPAQLPATPHVLWRQRMRGISLAGIAATDRLLVVADRDPNETEDFFEGRDADTGAVLWTLHYPAPGHLDYGSGPRATPVIYDGRVYLLGAFGHLHCVELETGKVLWQKHLVDDLGGKRVNWGYTAAPLIVDDRLILNPGGPEASLVALDRRDGHVLWKTPGGEAAYASFIVGTFGGVRQIVGYDAESLGGWDPNDGRRHWKLELEQVDFNVPTPLNVGGRLLVATENNGARLYAFDDQGRIVPKPLAQNKDLHPDAATPTVCNGLVFGIGKGGLACLDLNDGLRTRWVKEDARYEDYVSLIAGRDRLLATLPEGQVVLLRADGAAYAEEGAWQVFKPADMWAHPALVGTRLYLRNREELVALDLTH